MNIDADMLQTLNRIMPDAPPAISPQEQHRKALREQLTASQQQVEELASAIRLCDQDITAPQAIAGEIAALEQKRSEALAAGYLKRKAANVKQIEADIASLKASLAPARTKAEGAAAARAILVAELSQAQAIAARIERDLALSGALGTDAYRRASEVHRLDQQRENAARQQQIARDQDQQRQRADEERQRRQRMGQHGPIGPDPDIPAWLQNRSW